MSSKKGVRAWAGFTDGEICMVNTCGDWGEGLMPELFPTKKAARTMFSDVRRVIITEIPKKGRR